MRTQIQKQFSVLRNFETGCKFLHFSWCTQMSSWVTSLLAIVQKWQNTAVTSWCGWALNLDLNKNVCLLDMCCWRSGEAVGICDPQGNHTLMWILVSVVSPGDLVIESIGGSSSHNVCFFVHDDCAHGVGMGRGICSLLLSPPDLHPATHCFVGYVLCQPSLGYFISCGVPWAVWAAACFWIRYNVLKLKPVQGVGKKLRPDWNLGLGMVLVALNIASRKKLVVPSFLGTCWLKTERKHTRF